MGFPDSSVGKESACNAGDPGSIPGSGRFPGEWTRPPSPIFLGFPSGSDCKEFTCNAGDLGSISGLGRSSGGGHGYSLQYSCLENPHGQRSLVGYILRVTKSWTCVCSAPLFPFSETSVLHSILPNILKIVKDSVSFSSHR